MAPRNVSDFLRALRDLVRNEAAEWKRAAGWALAFASIARAVRKGSK